MKVCMIVTNGFEEVEMVGTFAILRRGGIEVDIYSLHDGDATGRFGLSCTNLRPFSEFDRDPYEALILPGGPQYKALEASDVLKQTIVQFLSDGKLVCAICASPTILGHMGLLEGVNYTCFTSMNEDFGGTYHETYAVHDGQFVTGRSAAASIDFGFAILGALMGEEHVKKIKESIYYEEY